MERLDTCEHKQKAAIVHGESDASNNYIIPYNVTINCICPQTHYWKLKRYTYEEHGLVQVFKCAKVVWWIDNILRLYTHTAIYRMCTFQCRKEGASLGSFAATYELICIQLITGAHARRSTCAFSRIKPW